MIICAMKNAKAIQTALCSLFLAVLLSGCLRGETKSLDDIYQIAKDAFTKASSAGLDSETTALLASVTKGLEVALTNTKKEDIVATLNEISNALGALIEKTDYTVRPALIELHKQYLELQNSEDISPAQLRLLIARTYSILTEELVSHKFSFKK